MSTDDADRVAPDPAEEPQEAPRRSKAELERIFGDVLPETTSDERSPSGPAPSDGWYLENRPPHHG